MDITSFKTSSYAMPCWMNHKLKSRLLGKISTISDMQMITTLTGEIEEEPKSLLLKVKEESEKAVFNLTLNLKFKKLRLWHSVPSLHIK